jgi:hypothetical protein
MNGFVWTQLWTVVEKGDEGKINLLLHIQAEADAKDKTV